MSSGRMTTRPPGRPSGRVPEPGTSPQAGAVRATHGGMSYLVDAPRGVTIGDVADAAARMAGLPDAAGPFTFATDIGRPLNRDRHVPMDWWATGATVELDLVTIPQVTVVVFWRGRHVEVPVPHGSTIQDVADEAARQFEIRDPCTLQSSTGRIYHRDDPTPDWWPEIPNGVGVGVGLWPIGDGA